jgi:hypothetical protein
MAVQKITQEQADAMLNKDPAPVTMGNQSYAGDSDKFSWKAVGGNSTTITKAVIEDEGANVIATLDMTKAGGHKAKTSIGDMIKAKLSEGANNLEDELVLKTHPDDSHGAVKLHIDAEGGMHAEPLPSIGTVKEAHATETTQMPDQAEEVQTYPVNPLKTPPIPAHELATVSVNLGLTLSLGNYQSAKIGVILTMPTSVGDIDATYEFAKTWAEDRITVMSDEVLKDSVPDQPEAYPSTGAPA